MNRRTLLLIALTFFVGALAGTVGAFITWQPYTLTRAIIRECGTHSRLNGDERCWRRVTDAFEKWEDHHYAGDIRLWRD